MIRSSAAAMVALFPLVARAAPPQPTPAPFLTAAHDPRVEFDMMTWPEVKAALAAGKTTALFYTGGTEQRGPQAVNGGHNLMAHATVVAIAERLGDAIAMPVLPFTPNNATPQLPGTIGLTDDILAAVLERVAEQAIVTGFRNVVLMGDHGGGQGPGKAYDFVAHRLDAKYAAQGIHVFYCGQVYAANFEFDRQTKAEGYPVGVHASLSDTSEMMYLDPDGSWIRRAELPNAVGGVPDAVRGGSPPSANGVKGDARRSSRELGKRAFDLKVDAAVKEIRSLTQPQTPAA